MATALAAVRLQPWQPDNVGEVHKKSFKGSSKGRVRAFEGHPNKGVGKAQQQNRGKICRAPLFRTCGPRREALPSAMSEEYDITDMQGFWRYEMLGIARRAKCGSRSVVVARMTEGKNDVKLVLESENGAKKKMMKDAKEQEEPFLLRIGVALVTELLRIFSNLGSSQPVIAVEEVAPSAAVENQNVVEILREDYERAYFLTGDFTTSLYDVNCLFADPTIQFRGRDKYQRNLKLLVPFFEEPRLTLFDIEEEGLKGEEDEQSINARWNLRTYLKLPWKPLIDVNGSTLYVIDANSKIVKHIESWSISGRQAVQQLFVPSKRASEGRKT